MGEFNANASVGTMSDAVDIGHNALLSAFPVPLTCLIP